MDSLLKKLYEIYSPSKGEKKMSKFIKSYARHLGCTVVGDNHNIYITKGIAETYPCIVAHTDQVQDNHSKDFTAHEVSGMVIGASKKNKRIEGLGADDKNGIWVALKCLEKYDVLKCAFFWGEEIGCCGSDDAIMEFFDDCRFVLQCDRKNSSDFITDASCTELCTEEFVAACNIEKFGYSVADGMMTDVMTLKENGLKVCACNISCGYHKPHTDEEYTVISELDNCLALVESIIENCTDVYPHVYEKKTYGSYKKYGGYGNYGGYTSYKYPTYDYKTKTLPLSDTKSAEDEYADMEYEELINDLSYYPEILGNATAEEIMSWYNITYPHLTLDHYKMAYDEVMDFVKGHDDDDYFLK